MSPDSVLMNVSNAGICNDTNYFYLQYKKPHAGFDKIYCGSVNDSTLLHFNPTECLFPNAVFRWFDRNNGNSTDTAQYVKQAGIYHVYFWDGKCLADSGKFTVSFYSKPEIHLNPPASVCSDSAVTLDAGNQLGMKIQWTLDGISDPKDTNQTIRINLPSNKQSTSTMIICTLSATNRCDTSRTATVNVSFIPCNIEIPNVFTPNGDGINDYLYIKNVDNINYMNWEVIIFNRWGRKVYETNNYINEDLSHSWNGDGSPEGVYYYVVRNSKNNQHYSGYVELIR